ncbi:MAG TPA: DUF192 domain-containing protein [Candidatus Saccharimonadales bacterium]|nr:DUF192 domain-containing protein [Candidatus Saccharimonadales bacterium]
MAKLAPLAKIILLLAIAAAAGMASYFTGRQTCTEVYRHDISLKINGKILNAQTAVTPAQQERGLSGRQCLSAGNAMLFAFPDAGYYYFWMKDMNFPIDIVWLSPAKQVVWINPDTAPSTYPGSFVSPSPAKYVLELKAGQATALGLGTGSYVSF